MRLQQTTQLIPLQFPIERGEKKDLETITIKRPKTRHVIQLTKLLGQELAQLVFEGDVRDLAQAIKDDAGDKAAESQLAARAKALFAPDKIEGLMAIAADLMGLEVDEAMEIDPADYPVIGKAFMDFFPALQGLMTLSSEAG